MECKSNKIDLRKKRKFDNNVQIKKWKKKKEIKEYISVQNYTNKFIITNKNIFFLLFW